MNTDRKNIRLIELYWIHWIYWYTDVSSSQPLKGNETNGEATNAAAPSRAKDERIKMYLGSTTLYQLITHCTTNLVEFFYFMFPRGFGGCFVAFQIYHDVWHPQAWRVSSGLSSARASNGRNTSLFRRKMLIGSSWILVYRYICISDTYNYMSR